MGAVDAELRQGFRERELEAVPGDEWKIGDK